MASRVAGWLRDAGHTVFLDHDMDGLRVGDGWADRLFAELYTADGLVAVVTAAFAVSPWCAAEVGIARAHGVRILPVRAERGVSHRLVSAETQWTDLEGDGTQARDALVDALRQLDGTGGAPWSAGLPIYPGLVPFDAGQARVFFGRDDEARRLAERLRVPASPAGAGLLALVGPSGCGKSSLARAGLGPLLAAEPDWLVLPPLVPADDPDADPVSALGRLLAAEARRRELGWPSGRAAAELARPDGLARLAADLLADAQPARHLLLLVDQAEELLTRTAVPARQAFAALLREATSRPGRVRAVATLRSEFLDPLAALAAQAGMPLGSFVLPPLAHDLLPLVITGPARHAGITVDDELVARMVADTGSGDALPLLAFVLNQLAEGVPRGGTLSAQRYSDLRGVRGALAGQANAALVAAAAATGRSESDVLAGLLRLVTVDETGQVSRRRVALTSLPARVRTELDAFVARRLLIITTASSERGDPAGGTGAPGLGPVIDIAHEQILTAWQPLATAIAAAMDTLRARASAADAADAWERAGRPTDHLWELGRATDAADTLKGDDLAPATRVFLTASRRHGRRRRVRAFAVLFALLLLAVSGGVRAVANQRQAAAQRDHAVARLAAAEAEKLRDSQPGLAKQLSIVAYRMDPQANTAPLLDNLETPGVYDAQDPVADIGQTTNGTTLALSTGREVALWDVDGHPKGRRIPLPGARAVALSPDGRLLAATASSTGPRGAALGLWNVTVPDRPVVVAVPPGTPAGVTSIAFSADGRLLALGTVTGVIQLWEVPGLATPRLLRDLTGHTGQVDSLAFAPSGTVLASAADDRSVRLWNLADRARSTAASVLGGAPIGTDLSDSPMHRVAFRPDGDVLAGPGDDDANGMRLWNVRDLARPALLTAKDDSGANCRNTLVSAAFRADGKVLATSCGDHLNLWTVDDPSRIDDVNDVQEPLPSSSGGGTTLFSPHGSWLLHATRFGVHLWDVENAPQLGAAGSFGPAPSGFDVAVRFSGGPRRLLAVQGASDGFLWDLSDQPPHHKLADLPGSGNIGAAGAAFNPDGSVLATSDQDGDRIVLHLRSTDHPRTPLATVSTFANGVGALAYSPDGRVLAVADNTSRTDQPAPPAVKLFDVTDPSHPSQLATMPGLVFRLTFAPHGHLLVGNTADTLMLWNISDPRHPVPEPTRYLTPGSMVSESVFRPDGKLLAVTDSADKTWLWQVDHDQLAHDPTVVRTIGSGTGIDFTPDGRTLAWTSSGNLSTGFGDKKGAIELWDVTDPKIPVYRASIAHNSTGLGGNEISFSKQGKPLLATVGSKVTVWSADPDTAVSYLCASVGDVISSDQWSKYIPNTPYQPPCPAFKF